MEWWSIALILAVILIPLCYALYYFGLLTSHATFAVFRASCSLPTRWEGKIADTTGFMRRNFVVFPKYSALSVDVETTSGTMEFEVRGPDGVLLSPVSGHNNNPGRPGNRPPCFVYRIARPTSLAASPMASPASRITLPAPRVRSPAASPISSPTPPPV